MRKRELEMMLERVKGFSSPKLNLEQYPTPAPIAAHMVHLAHMMGDVGGLVYDLGCGTGVLGIAAKLMGAEHVAGLDIDADAIADARTNACRLGVDVEFLVCDVAHTPLRGEAKGTVLMNPPFGAQKRGADRVFLRAALEIGEVIYSIHNEGSSQFVRRFVEPWTITHIYRTLCPIRRAYSHHTHEVVSIPVEIYRIKLKMQ
ncbi:MAG: METTL5 family protein [Methermicoccaceae archaeon]